MSNPPIPELPSPAQRQLNMPLDPGRLRGMSACERRTVLAQLASLLLEAAGIATEEHDDDER